MNVRIFSLVLVVIVCSACQHATKKPVELSVDQTTLAILSINDVYRIAGIDDGRTGGLARVRALRQQLEAQYDHVLFLHAGDFLHPSFISQQDDGLAMIQALNHMDGSAGSFDTHMVVTWGNHEFDNGRNKHIPLMNQLLDQSEFSWLGSNIIWQPDGIESDHMVRQMMLDFAGLKVGLFSFTTGMAHPEYIAEFGDYAGTAAQQVPDLRQQGADVVIGLTHQWLQDDLAMMQLPGAHRPDIIFGGHEHYVQTEQVNGRWVLKADADAASAVVVEVQADHQRVHFIPTIVQLNADFPQDPDTLKLVNQLVNTNDQAYCRDRNLPDTCLYEVLSLTHDRLMAEETEIRRFETNLGNVLADLVLTEFAGCQADIALLNSGSIRLNQNIPAGGNITVKHLEEMFPYPSDLRVIEISSERLQHMLNHSVSNWTANGHWLQVAGLSYVHDPEQETASRIQLKDHDLSDAASSIKAVVPYYLISDNTDQDGYTMLSEAMQVDCGFNGAELKTMFSEFLQQLPDGLHAKRDQRICNTTRDDCF